MEVKQRQYELADDSATVEFGHKLGEAVAGHSLTVYLQGELGAGKTTLSRGIIRYFGHTGAVKSPTYTLVEPYQLAKKAIFHFDLYRMAAADELSYLGLDDYFGQGNRLCLVEWPERGAGVLPPADLTVQLHYTSEGGELEGRQLTVVAHSPTGQQCLDALSALMQ